jgi:hypothetical protein
VPHESKITIPNGYYRGNDGRAGPVHGAYIRGYSVPYCLVMDRGLLMKTYEVTHTTNGTTTIADVYAKTVNDAIDGFKAKHYANVRTFKAHPFANEFKVIEKKEVAHG